MTEQVPSNQWGIDEAFKTLESLTEGSSAAKGAMRFLRSQLSKPAHEREMPHCSTCSCPPYQAPEPPAEPFGFVAALAVADRVFAQYQNDQPKWWKRMDGTPILNDVSVRMAQAFLEATQGPSQPPTQLRYEEGLAILYGVNYQAVARVCDEVIDRSGALLGRVRTLARIASPPGGG